ncbi:MAG TPA: glycine zipper 2TM domain-containing protein [Casimicrobiaceae bacterium]
MSTLPKRLGLGRASVLAVTAAVVGAPTPASAADFTDTAPVIASTPIYERVNHPRKECRNETVSYREPHRSGGSLLGAIVGGIAGGVIGHQIGSGTGNAIATGVGAVTGAVVGDKVDPNGGAFSHSANASTTREHVVQRCRPVADWQEVIRGYDVTYRYNGRDTTVRLPYDPGQNVRVAVGVIRESPPPVSYNAPQR